MICPKCKAKLNDNSLYCPRCGMYFSNNNKKDDDLLDYGIIDSKNNISPGNISFSYLLFGGIYAIYKKLYYVALNTFLVDLLASSFSFGFFTFLIDEKTFVYNILKPSLVLFAIIVHIYYVFNINNELLNNRGIRDNKIKRDNSGVDIDTLLNLLEKDRKNNFFGMIVSIIVLFLYFYLCFIKCYN